MNSPTPVPPDFLTTERENELLCEKLLGWKRAPSCGAQDWYMPLPLHCHTLATTPSFTTWAEAGLILDTLSSSGPTLEYSEGKWDCYGGDPFMSFFHAHADTGPLAIRAAALEFVKLVKR